MERGGEQPQIPIFRSSWERVPGSIGQKRKGEIPPKCWFWGGSPAQQARTVSTGVTRPGRLRGRDPNSNGDGRFQQREKKKKKKKDKKIKKHF